MKLFDGTNIPLLNKALDAYALRQRVLASNVANITTTGYKSQTVSFEDQLAKAASGLAVGGAQTEGGHVAFGTGQSISEIQPRVYDASEDRPEGSNAMASGFNDVDIDNEMAELAKNQIRFKFSSRLLGDAFKGMQKAIRGTL
jgi:flagellar basal-body rod protein FlgB